MILWLLAAATATELIGLLADERVLQWIGKPLLAPLLMWYLISRHRRDGVLAAMAFAFAGDVVLLVPGRAWFLAGMACFLGTQLCLLATFWRHARPRPAAVIAYATLWAALNALLWSQLGPLRLPILAYSLALAAMAAAATTVSPRVGVGGALFLLSDLLIGAGAAGLDFTGRDLTVMSTYCAALLLLATGWARTSARRPRRDEPSAGPVPQPARLPPH
jgi:uncharacterized membrane protein YhhN